MRAADVAWLWFDPGWAFVAGFRLYARTAPDEPLRRMLDPFAAFEASLTEEQRAQATPFMNRLMDSVTVDGLTAPNATPASCVADLRACSEVLCTSVALHAHASWDELSRLSVYDA